MGGSGCGLKELKEPGGIRFVVAMRFNGKTSES